MLRVDLVPGQTVVAEAGAMVARHQQVVDGGEAQRGPQGRLVRAA